MPFTPTFVDLVRNMTAVQGTGPVSLGAAVSGYSGFAEAVSAGDQFYYCIQGVDKPAEREVGRGTMQANGTIARQPISGSPTNFSNGAKTIALVTAAEWFDKLEAAGQSGASMEVASRAELAARPGAVGSVWLTENGREGLFVFSGANCAAPVAADGGQGLAVAPSSDPGGAAGAWLRKYSGSANVRWFGATGNGTSNDGPAFAAALAALKAIAVNDGGIYKGSPALFVPAGHYFLGTTTLDVTHTLRIEGEGNGQSGGIASKLRWAANTTGIRIQRYNTSGAGTIDGSSHYAGDATTVSGLYLMGAFTNFASEGEHHGVHLKARATIRDCFVTSFQGNGIHVQATAGGGPGLEGNANCFAIERCAVYYCQNGIYLNGADANAGYTQGCDLSHNRQWGLWDKSFLGNQHGAPHAANNGFADNGVAAGGLPPTIVSHNGNIYYVLAGQEAWCSTTAPSGTATSNQGWAFLNPGSPLGLSIPVWASGVPYRTGGCYRTDDDNAAIAIVGAYSEGGQAPPQTGGATLLIGGLWGCGIGRHGGYITGGVSHVSVPKDFNVGRTLSVAGSVQIGPMAGAAADLGVTFNNTSNYTTMAFRSWSGGVEQTDANLVVERNLGLIIDNAAACNFRVNNSNVLRFNAFNVDVLKPGAKLGYGDGTGGSVTQATSKSTAVILNKTNGQIVMHNAALAAGASVSFTLNNSILAASDTVIVNVAAGASADAYVAGVSQVAAGSCRIQLRNLSGGSLSEAVAINFAILKAVAA